MKIKTKVTTEQETEITIPFFRKDTLYTATDRYMAVLDENTKVDVYYSSASRAWISNEMVIGNEKDIAEAFNKWEEITESEFFDLYQKAMKDLTLSPILTEKPLTSTTQAGEGVGVINLKK